jgi:Tfp pilus assembly protein PilW
MKRRGHPRGIFLMDLMIALVMATALLMAMTVAVSALTRDERQMADTRAAARRLEMALAALQSGRAADAGVTIQRLPADPVGGEVWVRVSLPAPRDGTGQSLVGLVPSGHVPEGGAR